MNLDPQTTERLIGMVSSEDKENRVLAYAILEEYFMHIMFSFTRNIGYLLLIHRHMINDEDDLKQKGFLRLLNSYINIEKGIVMQRDRNNNYISYCTYSDIIDLVNRYIKESDFHQRRMVYKYACDSMRRTLKIKDE